MLAQSLAFPGPPTFVQIEVRGRYIGRTSDGAVFAHPLPQRRKPGVIFSSIPGDAISNLGYRSMVLSLHPQRHTQETEDHLIAGPGAFE